MKDLEVNKVLASVVVAGLIALVTGKVANFLYHPESHVEGEAAKRGYAVAVTDALSSGVVSEAKAEEVKIDVAALVAEADADKGKATFKKCAACHSVTKGGPNKVGPALYGVVGRAKASHGGYTYSTALQEKGGNWTEDDLFHFLSKPRKFVPGTKMGFAGLKKPKDAANMIAYLKTLK
jgi:cytochrome c